MFQSILNTNQLEILPLIQSFSDSFYLVGGTAIALQIGHRKSIDFDLFCFDPFDQEKIKKQIARSGYEMTLIYESNDQLHGFVNNVKLTFYEYPYPVKSEIMFENYIKMPTLVSLGAMKAFALGRRAKWKDYVDVYFLVKQGITLGEIAEKAESIFGSLFNPKLFYQQLAYFEDINYSEAIEFTKQSVSELDIKDFLVKAATEKIDL